MRGIGPKPEGFGESLLQTLALCMLWPCSQDAEHKGAQDTWAEVHVSVLLRIGVPLLFSRCLLSRFDELKSHFVGGHEKLLWRNFCKLYRKN